MPLRRSTALIATLCLSLMAFVCTAAVADEYVPIRQYHSGMWADPTIDGEGFNVYVSPDPLRAISVLSFLDVLYGETTPSWFLSNETPQRPITYLSLNRVSVGASYNMAAVGLVESGGLRRSAQTCAIALLEIRSRELVHQAAIETHRHTGQCADRERERVEAVVELDHHFLDLYSGSLDTGRGVLGNTLRERLLLEVHPVAGAHQVILLCVGG